jgi:hypothetical protein
MANVWFVERVGADWKTVGGEPAFRLPLAQLIFKLDLGPHRRQTPESTPERGDRLGREPAPHAKVFVEVTDDDLKDTYFGGYYPGWYDSPYSAQEAARRLG